MQQFKMPRQPQQTGYSSKYLFHAFLINEKSFFPRFGKVLQLYNTDIFIKKNQSVALLFVSDLDLSCISICHCFFKCM